MNATKFNVFILTGEASGDGHSAKLVDDLKRLNADIQVDAVGGKYLKKAGANIILDYKAINFIGFSSIIKNYSYLLKKIKFIINHIKNTNPDCVILTDFPGFNLTLAKRLSKFYKGKIYYYITPQVWAWKESRVKSIKKYFDGCFVIFPFEKEFFKKYNIKVHYINNPLLKEIEHFKQNFIKEQSKFYNIALLPGSRAEEFRRNMPVMVEYVNILYPSGKYNFTLIASENIKNELQKFANINHIKIESPDNNNNLKVLNNSDFVITKFGTSTLECGLLGIPFTVIYKASWINYFIAKLLIKIKYVSLVNIIFNKEIVKEYIQDDYTAENIIKETDKIINNIEYKNKMLKSFEQLRSYFNDYPEIENAAEIILKDFNKL